jgi:hypothetical protein
VQGWIPSTYKSATRGSFSAGIGLEEIGAIYKEEEKTSLEIRGILGGKITLKACNSASQA